MTAKELTEIVWSAKKYAAVLSGIFRLLFLKKTPSPARHTTYPITPGRNFSRVRGVSRPGQG
jgi:hypothetical protein